MGFVLDGQFEFTEKLLEGKTDDKILFYATETTLQLYMAETQALKRWQKCILCLATIKTQKADTWSAFLHKIKNSHRSTFYGY